MALHASDEQAKQNRVAPISMPSFEMEVEFDANQQIIPSRRRNVVLDQSILKRFQQGNVQPERRHQRDAGGDDSPSEDGEEEVTNDQQTSSVFEIEEPDQPSIMTLQYQTWTFLQKFLVDSLVTIGCVFLTWGFAFRGHKVGSSLSAVSTSTLASVLLPDLLIFASIGSYAGMTNVDDIRPVILVALLTSITAATFEKFKLFPGRGGRLGTSAFLGSILALGISCGAFPQKVDALYFYNPSVASYSLVDSYLVLNVLVCNLLGASGTYRFRKFRPLLSPVVAGNAISVLLIIILDSYVSPPLSNAMRVESSGCILQGAFVGMSSLVILPNIRHVWVAVALSSCITLLMYPLFPYGVGGKRGFMACVAVHLLLGLTTVLRVGATWMSAFMQGGSTVQADSKSSMAHKAIEDGLHTGMTDKKSNPALAFKIDVLPILR